MLPPKRQNLFPPFATTFDGDPAECSKHLGRARGMLSLMCRSIPPVKSRTETTADGVEIRVTTNPHHIYIKAGGSLFCTSFTDGDMGTKIYKNPFSPYTKGGLIDDALNPNMPTYHARINYWVDDKEKNTVSWEYVTRNIIGGVEKEGMVSINGIDGSFGIGKYPLCVGLMSDSRMMAIIEDESGLNRRAIIFQYILDFKNSIVHLNELSRINLGAFPFAAHYIKGILDDNGKTVVYQVSNMLKTFLIQVNMSDITTIIEGSDIFNLVDNSIAGIIDVRGNKVSFISYSASSDGFYIGDYEYNGVYYNNVGTYSESGTHNFHIWDGTTNTGDIVLTLNSSIESIVNFNGIIRETSYLIAPFLYTAKNNIGLYLVAVDNWDALIYGMPYAGLVTSTCEIHSTKLGVLDSNSGLPVDGVPYVFPSHSYSLLDYCYTQEAQILTFDSDGDASTIICKKKESKVINADTKNLSVTKLP